MDDQSLIKADGATIGNSLEKGINGQYNFAITNILKEAWQKTYGIKGTYWKALGIAVLLGIMALIGLVLVIGLVTGGSTFFAASKAVTELATQIVGELYLIGLIFLFTPLEAGILMIGAKWSIGEKVAAKSIFNYYRFWQRLWVVAVLLEVINFITEISHPYLLLQTLLLIIYIYISISYFMFPLLIADKQLDIGSALEASRKAISHHWFKMLWFIIVFILIVLGSLLTLGIALIWTLPMINNAIGILYREMFGISSGTGNVTNIIPRTE